MTTTQQADANIKAIRSISIIWFVPFIAMLIGAFAGLGITLKLYWEKLKFKLSRS